MLIRGHLLLAVLFFAACSEDDNCGGTDLAVEVGFIINRSACRAEGGGINIQVSGGYSPYSLFINEEPGGTLNSTFIDSDGSVFLSYDFDNVNKPNNVIRVVDQKGCTRSISVDVPIDEDLKLELVDLKDANSCTLNSGSVDVRVIGGSPPYFFDLGGLTNGPGVNTASFSGLVASTYSLKVTDKNECEDELLVEIKPGGGLLQLEVSATSATPCSGLSNAGTITATAIGGIPPYKFQLYDQSCVGPKMEPCPVGELTENTAFTGFSASKSYQIKVIDFVGCMRIAEITIPREQSAIVYGDISSILTIHCNTAGCHDGTLGATLDFRTYPIVKSMASKIKESIFFSMPPPNYPFSIPLTQDQKDKIICWVDDGALDN